MGRSAKALVLRGRADLKMTRPDRRAFTPAKQRRFFEALRATCNVLRSCEAAGTSSVTVYRHRKSSAAFRAQWAETLREAYADLELAMLERALNGTTRTVTASDGSVKQRLHEYPNAVALTLLRLHRDGVAEVSVEHDPADVDELRARIARKLGRLRERIEGERAKGDLAPGPA